MIGVKRSTETEGGLCEAQETNSHEEETNVN